MQANGGGDEPDDFKSFETNRLTTDHMRWSRNKAIIEAAPELALGSPTVGWLRAALRNSAMLLRSIGMVVAWEVMRMLTACGSN